MPTIPTFQDLYDEGESELVANPDHQFNDFSAGSWLDAFTGVAATEAKAVLRWMVKRFLTAFVSTAEGSDLDFIIRDRYGLEREVDETDADFRARALNWILNLSRATVPALRFYAESDADVTSAEVLEDFGAGIVTISLTIVSGAVVADVLARLNAGATAWRAAGITTTFVEAA